MTGLKEQAVVVVILNLISTFAQMRSASPKSLQKKQGLLFGLVMIYGLIVSRETLSIEDIVLIGLSYFFLLLAQFMETAA